MNRISKGLAIAAGVAVLAGAGLAVAQTVGQPGGPGGFMGGPMGPGYMGMHEGMGPRGFGDPATHLAALKTDLAIRADQEAAWGAYATAVQESAAKLHAARGAIDPGAMRDKSWDDRQAAMSGMREQHTQAFAAIRTAAEGLLPALDETQKAKAQTELPGLVGPGREAMARHAGMGMMGGMMGGPMGGPMRGPAR